MDICDENGNLKRTNFFNQKMEKLYVLKLENDKYYVGKTRDLESRITAHKKGNGAAWTKQHRVLKNTPECWTTTRSKIATPDIF